MAISNLASLPARFKGMGATSLWASVTMWPVMMRGLP